MAINWFQIPLVELEPFLTSLCGDHGNRQWFTNGDATIREDTRELVINFGNHTLTISPSCGIKHVSDKVYIREVFIEPKYCVKLVEWERLYPLGKHYSWWNGCVVGEQLSRDRDPWGWNEPHALLPKEGTLREIRRCWMDIRQEELKKEELLNKA
jgi:hypothetical protein